MPFAPGGLKYRADIDGLRALAVIAVILFHAKVPGFQGGYIGVDVFFVISGYLITQVLDASAAQSRMGALAQFYLRRARRILPALFVMLAACAATVTLLYLPSDLRNFGRSLALAVASLGNFAAWLNGGYFDPGERFTPLRHLWTIGVEEQFYLFYPLCLLLISGSRKVPRAVLLAAMAITSLLLAIWAADRWPIENYFMLPTRAWELLVGAVLAASPRLFRAADRTNHALALVGLAGLCAVIGCERVIRFPGTATLAACASTALLVIGNSTPSSPVRRVLSVRPVVLTGLISYSLYLWHAPILAIHNYYSIREPTGSELCVLLAVVYLIALGSWAAVEQPFRSKTIAARPSTFVPLAAMAALVLAGFGYWLVRTDGLPQRWDPRLLPTPVSVPYYPSIDPRCFNVPTDRIAAGALCSFGPQNERAKKVVVWGDSHAFALLAAYQSLANADGIRIYFGLQGACWPLAGWERASFGEFYRAQCSKFNAAMAQAIQRLHPQRVVLNAYWLDPGGPGEPEFRRRAPQTTSDVIAGARQTLDVVRTSGGSACAVLTVPGYPYPIPYALAMAERRGIDASTLAITRSQAFDQYRIVEDGFRQLEQRGSLRIADPKNALCPGSTCLIRSSDGAPLYRDANHMSIAGSRFLSGVLEQCLSDLH